MMLQDPKTGRQYTFELKDRLIRDNEYDGWKEIPVKHDSEAQKDPSVSDKDAQSAKSLPGRLCKKLDLRIELKLGPYWCLFCICK